VTTINPKIAADLLPSSQSLTVTAVISGPGVITFTQMLTHTLRNSGSISGTFAITATTSPLSWTTIVTPSQVSLLAPGETTTITVSVIIPAGTPLDTTNVVTVEVRELSQPQILLSSAQDTLLVKMLCFLPWMFREAFAAPGSSVQPPPQGQGDRETGRQGDKAQRGDSAPNTQHPAPNTQHPAPVL
jgi:hypothetical protein